MTNVLVSQNLGYSGYQDFMRIETPYNKNDDALKYAITQLFQTKKMPTQSYIKYPLSNDRIKSLIKEFGYHDKDTEYYYMISLGYKLVNYSGNKKVYVFEDDFEFETL